MMLKQYLGDLRDEFRGYNAAKFTKDLLAGLTVRRLRCRWRWHSVYPRVRMQPPV